MPFNAGILDPSIVSQGVRESKLDLTTPVNTYTSLRADQRAQKLSELTLSKEEKEQKKAADIQAIIKSSLTPEGHINSEQALAKLNRAGHYDVAMAIQDRMDAAQLKAETIQTKKEALESTQAKEMSNAFLSAADSKNPVEAFMLARKDGMEKGWKMSPGLLQYNPSDEEISTGKFKDPRVQQELIYHGEKVLTPEERIARAKAKGEAASANEYGLTPIYGKDAHGNTIALQTSKSGGVKQIDLPAGITLTPGVALHDLGDSIGIFDKSGTAIATVKKGIDPGKKEDLAYKGADLALKQAEDARKAEDQATKKLEVAKKARAYDRKNKGDLESIQTFLDKAHAVKDNPNMKYVTGAMGSASHIPGTGAADLQSDIDFLVSSGVIETLSNLKSQSPTGASGFGALSEKEMQTIQGAFSSLGNNKVSPNKKRDELDRVIKIMEKRQREYRALSKDSDALLGPEPTEADTLDAGINAL